MYLEVCGVDKIVGPPFSLVLGYSSFSPFFLLLMSSSTI